jgi:hypothetical protein
MFPCWQASGHVHSLWLGRALGAGPTVDDAGECAVLQAAHGNGWWCQPYMPFELVQNTHPTLLLAMMQLGEQHLTPSTIQAYLCWNADHRL